MSETQRTSVVTFLAAALALLALPAAASHSLGPTASASFTVSPAATPRTFTDAGANFLIVRLRADPGSVGDRVEVALGYDTDRFTLTPGQSYYTRPVSGASITLTYVDANGDGLGSATVDRYGKGTIADIFLTTSQPFGNFVWSSDGKCPGLPPSWQETACLSGGDPAQALMRTTARSVGMFVMLFGGNVSSCTAALIAPDLLLTAGHCVSDVEGVPSASFTLDYQTECGGARPPGYAPRFYKVTRLVRTGYLTESLDYAVLQVDTGAGGLGVPPLAMRRADQPLVAGEPLFAIHHPRGAPKKVSRQPFDATCSVQPGSTASWITHGCDVDHGSSGSPLFDLAGRIVGVNDTGGGCDNGTQGSPAITANFVSPVPPPADVNAVAVFDRSGSMSLPGASGGSKLAEAKEAEGLFISLLRTDRSHRAGLVSFSSTPSQDRMVAAVTPALKADYVGNPPGDPSVVTSYGAGGNTTIGGGLRAARELLDAAGGTNTPSILLMTDGLQNTHPYIDEADLGNARLCAVGFGTEASLDGPLLTRLARDHGGIYTRAGDPLSLKKFYALCFGNLFEAGISVDPYHALANGEYESAPVPIAVCGEETITAVIGWKDPVNRLSIELESPLGARIDAATPGIAGTGTGNTWAFLRLPLPFGGERDGTWKVRVRRPRGAEEFPGPSAPETFFLEMVIQGGPRLRPAPQPQVYTGDPLDPRVILRDSQGYRRDATVTVDVETPAEGTGNLLTRSGLGNPIAPGGDTLDARASTLIALEQARGAELIPRSESHAELFDDEDHGDRSFEPDGQFGNSLPELTRFEGDYTFHARADFVDGCTGTREAFWTTYVEVGIDPGSTTVTTTPTGDLPGGRKGLVLHVTPRDRYGNFLGPGRGDSIVVGGAPGTTTVGPVRDDGHGGYDVDAVWDPAVGNPPGVTVEQPGRPPVVIPPMPGGPPVGPPVSGSGRRSYGLALGEAFPLGSANRRLDSGLGAHVRAIWHLQPRFSLVAGLGYAGFSGLRPSGDFGVWDGALDARFDSAPLGTPRLFVEGGAGLYVPDRSGLGAAGTGIGLHLGAGIAVPFAAGKLDLTLGLEAHELLGGTAVPSFLRALIGLEVHP
jgi:hypothetical protein